MHWVTRVKHPLGFEPRSPAWEADDLPTELSLPLDVLQSSMIYQLYALMLIAHMTLSSWMWVHYIKIKLVTFTRALPFSTWKCHIHVVLFTCIYICECSVSMFLWELNPVSSFLNHFHIRPLFLLESVTHRTLSNLWSKLIIACYNTLENYTCINYLTVH